MEKKYTGKIIALMLLMFASSFGGTIETLLRADMDYDAAGLYGLLISLANMLLVSAVMMAVPFICRMVNKDKLPYKKGKRICLWNSIILFVMSSVLLAFVETGFIGGIGAIIFYFINKWVFVHQYDIENMTGYVCDDSVPAQETEQPIRVCLSPEGEQSQSRGSFNIYGSDIRLDADNKKQETPPNTQTAQSHTIETKPIVKYCSRCGTAIDPATKKCTGCSKQYFKGVSFKNVLVVLLIVFLIASIAGNVLLAVENRDLTKSADALQKTNSKLENKVSELKKDVSDLQKENAQYYDYWVETFDKMGFYDSTVVFIEDDGTNLYHKYECNKFIGADYWAHNVEYAEYIGYSPCPRCCD